jgi:ribosomal-protein-alanine N-acetyltransferase
MRIRTFTSADLDTLLAVQNASLPAVAWHREDYLWLAQDRSGLILVAESTGERLVGFGAWRQVLDEAELYNLAVSPSVRRKGIGRALVKEAHQQLQGRSVRKVFLEVRQSNRSAVAFYRSLGFEIIATMKDYYALPHESGYRMTARLTPAIAEEY